MRMKDLDSCKFCKTTLLNRIGHKLMHKPFCIDPSLAGILAVVIVFFLINLLFVLVSSILIISGVM